MSKWVKAIGMPRNDSKTIPKFLHKYIFMRFGAPRDIIKDEGTHFDKNLIGKVLQRYGVGHKISMKNYSQTNGQAEVSNRKIKQILENMVNPRRKDWSPKLDEALWSYNTFYIFLEVVYKKEGLHSSEVEKLDGAVSLLRGQARVWWTNATMRMSSDQVTWSFFLEEFKNKYVNSFESLERAQNERFIEQKAQMTKRTGASLSLEPSKRGRGFGFQPQTRFVSAASSSKDQIQLDLNRLN
ncbi:uncharacterized protein LOC120167021 [Hibiscus syriacus]|uniref:uncharacterized protein LOC120167021 n=1 Tax=Hibiscus syriacus TaxID=106335 RepID=UPI001922ADCB|nr:uncharacterized protein LOC120167021 [Hibiscus syriacus]